jgi:D-alanine-D-alanine ligase
MSARTATSTADLSARYAHLPLGLEQATVAVLAGGRSSERDVSLASGRMVLDALRVSEATDDRRGPARVIGVEILPDGRWRYGKSVSLPGEAIVALGDVDVFFSALHGGEGENGALQGFLTCCDAAFTGSGVIASAVAMDKGYARELVRVGGVRVESALALSRARLPLGPADQRALESLLARGCVVKPRRGGSSVGCSLARTREEFERALALAFEEGPEVLAEAFVQGVETTGAVLEAPDGTLIALPPVEIRPRGTFFDYHEKYDADGALELCPPLGIPPEECARIEAAALAAHRALGCEGYSRSDFILPSAGGEPVYLETNTLPGLTPRSLLPKAAAAVGIDYRTLCLWIARSGLARGAERRNG